MGEGRGTQDKRGAWGREGTQEKRRGRGMGGDTGQEEEGMRRGENGSRQGREGSRRWCA